MAPIRFLFTLALALALPVLPGPDGTSPWLVASALADDDGDDGGDDDDGPAASSGSRGSGGGSRASSTPSRRPTAAPVRPVRPGRSTPAPAPTPAPVAVLPGFAAAEVVAIGLSPADLATLQALGYGVLEERILPSLGGLTALRLSVPAGRSLEDARNELRQIAPGTAADFNHFYRGEQAPSLPPPCSGPACAARSQVQWPLPPEGPLAGCETGGVIGMIDTDVNPDHEALGPDRVEVVRLAAQTHAASDRLHGTAVAALLVGAAGSRTPGLLPAARLIAVDAFHKVGRDERSDVFSLIAGLDLLADRGVKVINLSLAGPPNQTLERMVSALSARGVLMVAAVGNGGAQSGPAWPAAYPQVLAVTAVDGRGAIYRRAVQGPHVELAAPGVEVWTASAAKGGQRRNGTSFAAPFVAAAAHILMERGLSAPQTRIALAAEAADLGPPGPDSVFGYGLLNAARICELQAG